MAQSTHFIRQCLTIQPVISFQVQAGWCRIWCRTWQMETNGRCGTTTAWGEGSCHQSDSGYHQEIVYRKLKKNMSTKKTTDSCFFVQLCSSWEPFHLSCYFIFVQPLENWNFKEEKKPQKRFENLNKRITKKSMDTVSWGPLEN